MRIFVSYASEQRALAETMIARLAAQGHAVTAGSQLLAPGDEFDGRIRSAIRRASIFIFLISPESLSPGRYTLTEVGYARAKWRNPVGHVLPVVVSQVATKSVHPYLGAITWLEPEGNMVAAVVDAVARMQHRWARRAVAVSAAVALLPVGGGAWALWRSPRTQPSAMEVPLLARNVPAAAGAPAPSERAPFEQSTAPPRHREVRPRSDPLSAFVMNRRCRAAVGENGGRAYLTCVCPDGVTVGHDDLFLGTAEPAATVDKIAIAVRQAKHEGWSCP
jgi:hypothetical protein